MKNLAINTILNTSQNAMETTWKNRYKDITPTITRHGETIELRTLDDDIRIDAFDEIVLDLVLQFTFMPAWIVCKWYEEKGVFSDEGGVGKIKDFVATGLVWLEGSVTGEYLRPTYLLFKLFNQTPSPFAMIPFNTLTHTISEAQVMFEIMTGTSVINSQFSFIPRISKLGFKEGISGTNIIKESEFRNPGLYRSKDGKEISEQENEIATAIREGKRVTPELIDFRKFPIAKKVDNTGVVKKDWMFQISDLIIPMPRKEDSSANSVALEVELTMKGVKAYISALSRYKDNNRFGAVIWLCSENKTAEALKMAFKEIGGLGPCKMKLMEFIVPSPDPILG